MGDGVCVYAIGDIHGHNDYLQDVFARIDADRETVNGLEILEIYLGDYVDRGPDSAGVLNALIERSLHRQVVALKGNHESFFLDALGAFERVARWQPAGGLATIASYGARPSLPLRDETARQLWEEWTPTVPKAHQRFLHALPLHHQVGDYFFCHAGVRPGVQLDLQEEQDILWIRDAFLNSTKWHGARVVHGHTPVDEPMVLPNRINIDTGAYMTGHLACLKLVGSDVSFI